MKDPGHPLISIIIPVYNVEQYLDRCIQSIMNQDYSFYEVLLIDDGSVDGSGDLCDKWAQKDKRIKVFHQQNGGLSNARNRGLDEMQGDYVCFVDSDDYLANNNLSYLLSLFSANDCCSVTACNHYIVRNGKAKPCFSSDKSFTVFTCKEAMEEVLFHGNVDVSAWGKLYKKSVFSDIRYPDGRIYEDTWLFGDVLKKTESIIVGKECCYYYVIREQSIATSAYSSNKLLYIEAAEKLAKDAMEYGQDMEIACIRRINHARLSVLRQMEHCEKKDRSIRTELRNAILKEAPEFLYHPKTPARDKFAIALLRVSLKTFYSGWKMYSCIRGI